MDKTKRKLSILEHIARWCDEIVDTHKSFGNDKSAFQQNKDYFKSISMSLLQIGELVSHLSANLTEKYTNVEWGKIVGLRNIIVHGYGILETEMLWVFSHNHTPELKRQCNEIINEIKSHI